MSDPRSPALYEFAFWVQYVLYTFGFSMRTEGQRNIPKRGPALLIANHQSFLDPVAVGLAARRHICFLAKRSLFHGWFGKFLRRVNCVPVDQEGIATDAMRTVLNLFKEGEPVLVFPEGERTLTGQMLPLRPGIHLLIRRGQVPIIPVGIAGAYQAFSRHMKWPRLSPLFLPATGTGMAVSIGRPLDPARYAAMNREETLNELFQEIHKVQQRAERLRRKN